MRYRRADVVDRAIALLNEVGLDAMSMRRLAVDLGVQPSALYHHFSSKYELLGAVVDELFVRGRRPTEVVTWRAELELVCVELRDIMVAHRDGAALVSTVRALGVGGEEPMRRMTDALRWVGADDELARVGARMLFHYVFGQVIDEGTSVAPPEADDFTIGLSVILDGLANRLAQRSQPG